MVFLKERICAGFPTGLFFGDGLLAKIAVSSPEDREVVLTAGLRMLLARSRIRGLRLAVPADGPEMLAVARIGKSLKVETRQRSIDHHDLLLLPSDYGTFLSSLGYKTRRNFRYYRRQSESCGNVFVPEMAIAEVEAAASHLMPNCKTAPSPRSAEEWLQMLSIVENPMIVGLRSPSGKWLSMAAGWVDGERATILIQLNNDREFWKASLSVVLRAYLVETLIESGIREILFWKGSEAPLSRYCNSLPATAVYIDVGTFGWRIGRSLLSHVLTCVPKRYRAEKEWVDWITAPADKRVLTSFVYFGLASAACSDLGAIL